jgi:hypothetical protein
MARIVKGDRCVRIFLTQPAHHEPTIAGGVGIAGIRAESQGSSEEHDREGLSFFRLVGEIGNGGWSRPEDEQPETLTEKKTQQKHGYL